MFFIKTLFLEGINSLTKEQILDRTKFKAFADDKMYLTQMFYFVFDRVQNIMGKRESPG